MARSEAQKAADKRYRETHKNDSIKWTTWLKPDEAAEIDAIIKRYEQSTILTLGGGRFERQKQVRKAQKAGCRTVARFYYVRR